MSIVLVGSTSGSITLQEPAVAGTTVLDLPATSGTVAVLDGSNNLSVAGNLSFNSGYGSSAVAYGCRAWVNFNGQGTVAIRASGNVSSITDNDTGDYTVNFTTAMPNANYTYVCSGSLNDETSNNLTLLVGGYRPVSPTTSALRIVSTYITSGTYSSIDPRIINVAVFR